MVSGKVVISNLAGLHLRPAGILCKEAMHFESTIHLECCNRTVNAKSILGILGACVKSGDEVTFICEGADEKKALEKMIEVVLNDLDD